MIFGRPVGAGKCKNGRTALESRRLGFAMSCWMRLVKLFKASRPPFSHPSHGQMGLGECQAAWTWMLLSRSGSRRTPRSLRRVTRYWNEHFFPPLALGDQGNGQENGVPVPLQASHSLSLSVPPSLGSGLQTSAHSICIGSCLSNALDAWAPSHLGEGMCREGEEWVLIAPKPPYGLYISPCKTQACGR